MMQHNLVLILDEAVENHDFIKTNVEKAYGDEIEVRIEVPLNTIEEMINHIQEYGERLASLVLDEKLNETGDANYYGSELAEVYRSYDSKIPIYILTSYPGDVDDASGDIEYVIDKNDLLDDVKIENISKKLRRHVDVFRDMVDKRKMRLDELLLKQLDSSLTADELQEFKSLQFWRARPIELEESILSEELKNSLDEKENILNELENILNKEK